MKLSARYGSFVFPLLSVFAQTSEVDPAGVLGRYAIARFAGSGADSVQAIGVSPSGDIFVAGTTSSSNLPLSQPALPGTGERALLRSADGGQTWTGLTTPPTIALDFAVHPTDPDTLLLAGNDGLYKSGDGGHSWRNVRAWTLPVVRASAQVLNLAFDPAHPAVAYAATLGWSSGGFFLVSTDNGESWTPRQVVDASGWSDSAARQVWVDPWGSGAVFYGQIYSRDFGVTWTAMTRPPRGVPTVYYFVPDPRHPGWIYAVTASGALGNVALSKDWGATWTQQASPGSGMVGDLLVDPELPNTLYAAGRGKVYVSADDGATWSARGATGVPSSPAGRLALLRRTCGGGALLATDGSSVLASGDFGNTWTPPQLANVSFLATGPGCSAYAFRIVTTDAFVSKLAPDGAVIWTRTLGGLGAETAFRVAAGPAGGVLVAGQTESKDFPSTAPRLGPAGQSSVFVAQFDAQGNLMSSTLVGAESPLSLSGFSADAHGGSRLAGTTWARALPVTAGAFQPEPDERQTAFAIGVAPDGAVSYVTYLPFEPDQDVPESIGSPARLIPVAILAEDDGSALVGGRGPALQRLSADGSSLAVAFDELPGQVDVIERGRDGNIYVAGTFITPPLGSQPCYFGTRYGADVFLPAADTYVARLDAATLRPGYVSPFSGACRTAPTSLAADERGAVTLGLWSHGDYPLRDPVLASRYEAAPVMRIEPDGRTVSFSSYVPFHTSDGIVVPVAAALDGTPLAAVNSQGMDAPRHGALLGLPVPAGRALSIESIADAVDGTPGALRPGSLIAIGGRGLAPDWVDVGLNNPDPLPLSLGGVQVLLNGEPAEMFQAAPEHLLFLVPDRLEKSRPVTVQVVGVSESSTPCVVPVESRSPSLLTRDFPWLPGPNADGLIRNEDGSVNDTANPAAPGSVVTLYATGFEGPGSTPVLWAPRRVAPGTLAQTALTGEVVAMPGFLRALFAVRFRVPDALGPGVEYLPPPGVVTRVEIAVGSKAGIYVK